MSKPNENEKSQRSDRLKLQDLDRSSVKPFFTSFRPAVPPTKEKWRLLFQSIPQPLDDEPKKAPEPITAYSIKPSCLRGYELGDILGYGQFGYVFDCFSDTEKTHPMVVKLLPLGNGVNTITSVNEEVRNLKRMHEFKIGPRLVDAWVCDSLNQTEDDDPVKGHVAFIVMERVPGIPLAEFDTKFKILRRSTKNFVYKERQTELNRMYKQMDQLKTNEKWHHRDLHSNNILVTYKLDTKTKEPFDIHMRVIDFGAMHYSGKDEYYLRREEDESELYRQAREDQNLPYWHRRLDSPIVHYDDKRDRTTFVSTFSRFVRDKSIVYQMEWRVRNVPDYLSRLSMTIHNPKRIVFHMTHKNIEELPERIIRDTFYYLLYKIVRVQDVDLDAAIETTVPADNPVRLDVYESMKFLKDPEQPNNPKFIHLTTFVDEQLQRL